MIPIYVDDVSEKSADAWEELVIDAYNGSGRGTRLHGIDTFHTLPIVSANLCIGTDWQQAQMYVDCPHTSANSTEGRQLSKQWEKKRQSHAIS